LVDATNATAEFAGSRDAHFQERSVDLVGAKP
jgi:hypothetical protein